MLGREPKMSEPISQVLLHKIPQKVQRNAKKNICSIKMPAALPVAEQGEGNHLGDNRSSYHLEQSK